MQKLPQPLTGGSARPRHTTRARQDWGKSVPEPTPELSALPGGARAGAAPFPAA
jgi:hypothetical protein